MMASMGPNFSPHPGGMPQHPGVPPGHPGMAPGMAHNPSQPGAQPGAMQHLHMGVSGPNQQVNPAAMMGGMPPGAGPNAHAMQHLNPQQAQLFQQQQHLNQMAFANNPSLQAQLQQQQRYQQLQQQQQTRQMLMNQHAMYPGMQMGGPMMNMNPQQLAAMRQRAAAMGQPLPQTPQQAALLAQQIAIQQQMANGPLAAGQNPNHPGQLTPNQLSIQQAQMAAIQAQQAQHAQAQAQAAAANQQAQGQPQQPQQGQPQQGQPQPQTPQQPGQAGPSPTVAPQNPAHGQGQQPQQGGQQPQPGQQQAGQPNPAQGNPLTPQQAAQQQAAQQQAVANNLLAQQHNKREGLKGQCLLKLMLFGEHLSGFSAGSRGKDDVTYWNEFVQRFFSNRGVFRHTIQEIVGEEVMEKQHEIPYTALARYLRTYFDSGVKNIQLIMDKGMSDKPLGGDCHFIENTNASMVYWYDTSHVVTTGILRAQFDAEQKLELFEFHCTGHEEYISRRLAIQAAKPAHNWVKEWHNLNADAKQSPEMSKKKSKPAKSPPNPPPDLELPHSAVKQNMGITSAVFQFLEIVEIMGQMNPLFNFYHTNPGMAPYTALGQYVANIGNNAAPPNINGQPMPQGQPGTPGFGQMGLGASPHAAHLQLPGSPHVGSPAQGSMQAPGMHPSQSQQGTSSSGPSANTSPAGAKRRRPSGVKTEDDINTPASAPTPSGGAQVNGIQNKAKPPTPRMPKKAKVSAAQ